MRISPGSGFSRAAAVIAGCPLSREKYYRSARVATSGFSPMRRAKSSICTTLERILRKPSDRKSVVQGKGVSVRVDLGGGGINKKKQEQEEMGYSQTREKAAAKSRSGDITNRCMHNE